MITILCKPAARKIGLNCGFLDLGHAIIRDTPLNLFNENFMRRQMVFAVFAFAGLQSSANAQLALELDGQLVETQAPLEQAGVRVVNGQKRLEIFTAAEDIRCAINPDFEGEFAPLDVPVEGDFVLAIDHFDTDLPGDGEYVINGANGSVSQVFGDPSVPGPLLRVVSNAERVETCDESQPVQCAVLACAPGGTPVFANDFETPPPPQVDLVAGSEHGSPSVAGSGPDNVALALTLTNPAGEDSATNVVATIDESGIPATVTGDGPIASAGTFSSSTREWRIPEFQVGASERLDYLLTAPKDTPDGAQVCVALTGFTADQEVINTGDDSSQACVSVVRETDLKVVVSDPPEPSTAGDSINYLVQLQNLGPSVASGVAVEIGLNLPDGATLANSIAVPGSFVEDTSVWMLGGVDVNESTAPTLTIQIDTAGMTADGTVQVDAKVSASNENDPDPGNDSDSDTTQVSVTP